MAILFDDASSEYMFASSGLVSDEPLTMACWFNTDTTSLGQVLMSAGNNGADGAWFLRASGDVANDPVAAHKNSDAGVSSSAVSSTGYTANTWHHAAAVFTSNTSRAAFIDGGSKGTNATSVGDPSPDFLSIGAIRRDTASNFVSGMIAEAAVWSIALSDAEVALLASGCSPLFVRPESLIFYLPLISLGGGGTQADWIGGLTMTETNTPASATHPQSIFYPPQFTTGFEGATLSSVLSAIIKYTSSFLAVPLSAMYRIFSSSVPRTTFITNDGE